MATHIGSEGLLYIGNNAIGELKSFSFDESASVINESNLNDTAERYRAGTTSWTGSCEAALDETDTAQGALTIGAKVGVKFYFEGNQSGDTYRHGECIVTSINSSVTENEITRVSFSFQGTGVLATDTV